MNQKNLLLIIIGLVVVLAATSFVFLTYIADYTFEDERISVSVPAQTTFKVTASKGTGGTSIKYNSNDKIIIDLIKVDDTGTIFGADAYDIVKNVLQKDLADNKNYTVVSVTDNYTIYYNKEKNQYSVLIFDDNKKVVVQIACDSKELIEKLANSFVLKAFTTSGLEISKTNDNNTGNNTSNTSPNQNKQKDKYQLYLDDAYSHYEVEGPENVMSEKEFYESGQDKYY